MQFKTYLNKKGQVALMGVIVAGVIGGVVMYSTTKQMASLSQTSRSTESKNYEQELISAVKEALGNFNNCSNNLKPNNQEEGTAQNTISTTNKTGNINALYAYDSGTAILPPLLKAGEDFKQSLEVIKMGLYLRTDPKDFDYSNDAAPAINESDRTFRIYFKRKGLGDHNTDQTKTGECSFSPLKTGSCFNYEYDLLNYKTDSSNAVIACVPFIDPSPDRDCSYDTDCANNPVKPNGLRDKYCAKGQCVECTDENQSQCSTGKPCVNNVCSQCTAGNATCPSGKVCETNPGKNFNQCVECTADDSSACTSGTTLCQTDQLSPNLNECVQCTAGDDSACPGKCETTYASPNESSCVECLNDSHCQGRTRNRNTNQSAEICHTDFSKPDGSNKCVQCKDTSVNDADEGCENFGEDWKHCRFDNNEGQWVCVQCETDAHCANNSNMGNNKACHPADRGNINKRGHCVECTDNSHCNSDIGKMGLFCYEKYKKNNNYVHKCGCETNADCGTEYVCEGSYMNGQRVTGSRNRNILNHNLVQHGADYFGHYASFVDEPKKAGMCVQPGSGNHCESGSTYTYSERRCGHYNPNSHTWSYSDTVCTLPP